jgi:hypothetical protein
MPDAVRTALRDVEVLGTHSDQHHMMRAIACAVVATQLDVRRRRVAESMRLDNEADLATDDAILAEGCPRNLSGCVRPHTLRIIVGNLIRPQGDLGDRSAFRITKLRLVGDRRRVEVQDNGAQITFAEACLRDINQETYRVADLELCHGIQLTSRTSLSMLECRTRS